MLLLLRLILATLIIFYSPISYGTEPNSPTLTLGSVLNDKGQPLEIPNKPKSHFNYSPPPIESSSSPSPKIRRNQKSSPKKTKAKSRKQQLASRSSVANDPSCRWLNGRMNSLERNLNGELNSRNRHYQQELNIRQDEWECMKCGAEGPEQSDHAECQYKR